MRRTVAMVLVAVMMLSVSVAGFADSRFTPGTYSTTVDAYGGPLGISVTLSEDKIESIDITECHETNFLGIDAIEILTQRILEAQSLGVDAVTGASITGSMFLMGVRDCVSQSGADMNVMNKRIEHVKSDEIQKLEADVVIVGAGMTGLIAAARASDLGLNVICVEKLSITGGSAKTSSGSYIVYEGVENEGYHITDEEDNLEDASARWLEFQENSYFDTQYPDMNRVRFHMVNCMYTLDWLSKEYGVTYTPRNKIAERGMAIVVGDIPEITEGKNEGKILYRLKERALENGMQLLLETKAEELITDGDKVIGVRATGKDADYEIYGKSVILATGGYSQNPEMVERLIPSIGSEITSVGSAGNVGDGIVMAEAVGAALYEDQFIHTCWPGPTRKFLSASPYAKIFMDSSSPLKDVNESTYYRLMVDKDGNRFMNEGEHYSAQILDMIKHAGAPYWGLYCGLEGVALDVAEKGVPTGEVLKGNTIAELAEQAGMDAAVFEATVERYRAACDAGVDEEYGKDPKYLKPVDDGPYYLIHFVPGACDTLGGVKTNWDQQVLREDGSVIEGLYAVGAMSNRALYNQAYFSGSQLSFGATASKIAAEKAAEACGITVD